MAGVSNSSMIIVPLAPSTILRVRSRSDRSRGAGNFVEGTDVGGGCEVLKGLTVGLLGSVCDGTSGKTPAP